MAVKKRYFSLTTKGGNSFQPDGQCLKFTDKLVNIGETADCDVRYDSGASKPEYFASIIRNDDDESWRIVLRSSHTDILVDGKGSIGYAYQLENGDIVRFEGQSQALQFHTHFDDKYQEPAVRHSLWQWIAAVACLLFIVAFVWYFNSRPTAAINEKDIEPFEESIFLVKVDSAQLKLVTPDSEELLRPTKSLSEDTPTGTAFLTSDHLLVTARHCVEYWIGSNLDLTTKVADLPKDDIVRWAIDAETFNQRSHADSTMLIDVFFSIYDFLGGKRYSFALSDSCVHVNRSKDGLFTLADFSQDYYWRSIRPYFSDSQMELGDILWIEGIPDTSQIEIATIKDLEQVKKGQRLMIYGYPITGMSDRRATFAEGVIKHPASPATENLVFEANINHGFSGGPLFTRTDRGVAVVGVVSRVDSISSGIYKRAVPITEISITEGGQNHE